MVPNCSSWKHNVVWVTMRLSSIKLQTVCTEVLCRLKSQRLPPWFAFFFFSPTCKKGYFWKIDAVGSGILAGRAASAKLWGRLIIELTSAEFTALLESENLHKEICLWLWWEMLVCSRSLFDLLSSPSLQSFLWLFVEGGNSFPDEESLPMWSVCSCS